MLALDSVLPFDLDALTATTHWALAPQLQRRSRGLPEPAPAGRRPFFALGRRQRGDGVLARAVLQEDVLDRRRWHTRDELHEAVVFRIETRQAAVAA